ncbi:hypothetical protein U3516DRAFT_918677 [Neocallimastix sp. 'constans']|jgi:hypothetical protein
MKNLIYFIFVICITILFANAEDKIDVNWMSFLSDDTYLNNINIPGTHDSEN